MVIKKSNINDLQMFLRQALEIDADPILTNKEIVHELKAEILALRKAGHSFQKIAELLKQSGASVSESTLKTYMQEANKSKTKKQTSKKNQTQLERVDLPI